MTNTHKHYFKFQCFDCYRSKEDRTDQINPDPPLCSGCGKKMQETKSSLWPHERVVKEKSK